MNILSVEKCTAKPEPAKITVIATTIVVASFLGSQASWVGPGNDAIIAACDMISHSAAT